MIKLTRGPRRSAFDDPYARRTLEDARKFFATPQSRRRQRKFDFSPFLKWADDRLREPALALSTGKCAFCERISIRREIKLGTYRPITGVSEESGAFLQDHYWGQAFAWENYLPVCVTCTRSKEARFPVSGQRAAPDADGAALAAEQAVLLDPFVDDPAPHFAFLPDGSIAGRTPRGLHTIEMLALNRDGLREERVNEARRFAAAMLAGDATVKALLSPVMPFLAMKRMLRESLDHRNAASASRRAAQKTVRRAQHEQTSFDQQRAAVSTEKSSGLEHYRARARFVERIEIRNFLAIESLDLDVSRSASERAPCLAVLGENAVGKSSVLKAVALALGGAACVKRLRLTPRDLLRRGTDAGRVSVSVSGFPEPVVMEFRRRGRSVTFAAGPSKALLLAYGSSRLLPTARHRPRPGLRHAKVENLFDPFLPLSDAAAWLATVPKAHFDDAARCIRDLLLLPEDTSLVRTRGRPGGVFLEFAPRTRRDAASRQPFDRLSDGYQSMLGFAADLMQIMFGQGYESMGAAQGVVLIDELGNHLHPRWRMQIVGRLRATFPSVQFLFSTHDPLCLRGLEAGEVVALQLDARRSVYALTDLPPVAGMRVDQLLRSEHFGMGSTVDPEMQKDYDRYLELKRDPPTNATEIASLQRRLFDPRLIASTQGERVALEVMEEARLRGPATPERALSARRLSDEAKASLRGLGDLLLMQGGPGKGGTPKGPAGGSLPAGGAS
jgi:hypothetical protein